jgi:hypothetical protein
MFGFQIYVYSFKGIIVIYLHILKSESLKRLLLVSELRVCFGKGSFCQYVKAYANIRPFVPAFDHLCQHSPTCASIRPLETASPSYASSRSIMPA